MNRDQLATCICIAVVSAGFAGGIMLAYLRKPFPFKWAIEASIDWIGAGIFLIGIPCCIGWSIAWLVIKLRT